MDINFTLTVHDVKTKDDSEERTVQYLIPTVLAQYVTIQYSNVYSEADNYGFSSKKLIQLPLRCMGCHIYMVEKEKFVK